MPCPPDVAEVLVEILKLGLLRIRACGYQGNGRRCAYEADHIHNLPALLIDFTPQLLSFYWRTERPLFVSQVSEAECRAFQSAWGRLEMLVKRECHSAEHSLASAR